jgi:hypothetical protein
VGYTKTRAVVKRNLEQLERLYRAKTTLTFKSDNPTELAYKLREAIAAAKEFSEYEHLAELRTMYKFRTAPGRVIALYSVTEAPVETAEASVKTPEKKRKRKRKVVVDAVTLLDIVGAMIDFVDEEEVQFININLSEEDLFKAFVWGKENGWKLINHEEAGITLTKRDVPEEVLWTP